MLTFQQLIYLLYIVEQMRDRTNGAPEWEHLEDIWWQIHDMMYLTAND